MTMLLVRDLKMNGSQASLLAGHDSMISFGRLTSAQGIVGVILVRFKYGGIRKDAA